MQPWSQVREHRGRRKLFVDGEPFLALGIQIDFLNCTKVEDFDYLFPHIVKLGCNTVFFPVRWFVVEPEEGRFDWTVLDHALRRCRENDLRMSVLWFGTNQGGEARPAPAWVKDNRDRFPRIRTAPGGTEANGLCPSQPETLRVEKRALDAMLRHLAEVDGAQHTTILMQVENEVCLAMSHEKGAAGPRPIIDPWPARCCCPRCNELYASDVGGGEWPFGVRSLTRYLNGLLADQKAIFPVPTYVNFPINPCRPGEDVTQYLDECPVLDMVAPDYYGFSDADLAFACRYFARGRNALLIAEHSTESVGDADRNLYLAIAEHGACGFDPWAIDHTFGWRAWRDGITERPFVGRDGSWSDMAVAFGRAQSALRCAVRPVARAVGTEDLLYYIAPRMPRKMEERCWGLHWVLSAGKDGKCLIARASDDDFTIVGVDTQVTVRPVSRDRALSLEEGRWHNDEWIATREIPAPELRAEADQAQSPPRVFHVEGSKAFRLRVR